MDQSSKYSINTLCVQGGYTPGNGEPRQIPIVQSTTFKYDSSDDMGKLFDLQASGYFYSRLQNPTCDTVAAKITELELSDRGSWTLTIESPTIPPTKIELGRDANGAAVEERLRQVVEAYPRIVEIMGGPPASLDAPYRRAIAAGKVNREQVAEYLASVQAVSAQSSARPSLGDADGAADAAAEAEASSSKDSVDDIEAASAADDAADAASSESHETEGGAAAR